jgi:hypothetical protein
MKQTTNECKDSTSISFWKLKLYAHFFRIAKELAFGTVRILLKLIKFYQIEFNINKMISKAGFFDYLYENFLFF